MSLVRAIAATFLCFGSVAAWDRALAADPPAKTESDMVWLNSGERLRGHLVSFDRERGLVWRHPNIEEDLPFKTTNLIRIRLGSQSFTKRAETLPCLVRLANGDELEGDLESFDGKTLKLDTWYAGALLIPRGRIESVQPIVTNPKVVFQGPTSLEGWTLGEAVLPTIQTNAWTFADGSLVSSAAGSIARDVKLPEVASLDFDLGWNNYLNLAIALYADSLQPISLSAKDDAPDFGGFYSLQLNANIANVLTVKKGAPLNSLGLAFIPGMEMKSRAHVTVRVHKRERAIYLYLDGTLVKQWRDPQDTPDEGTAIRFVNQGPNSLKISNLAVAEWDGRLDLLTNVVNNATTDLVRLLNRDSVAGSIHELRDGNLKVATTFGPMDVPVNRIEQIHFSKKGRDPLALTGTEVNAQFAKRGHLTLQLESWDKDSLVATSPVFGQARFNPAAFRLLTWRNR